MSEYLILAQTLRYIGDPFLSPWQEVTLHDPDGAVHVKDGRIQDIGPATTLRGQFPALPVEDWRGHLLMAGFVDAHVHYPQTGIIASWGERLLPWLQTYTFPEEMRFADAHYAQQVAETYLDLSLSNGITTASSYCTIHPQSVDALMGAAQARGMAMAAGSVMMDSNDLHPPLQDEAQESYDRSKALIDKWHGQDRLVYAVTPRFALTSTPAQLEMAGALWAEHPTCLMQTHLSEQPEEIARAAELYPGAKDYLGIYEDFGLTGVGANMGHSIHLKPREIALMAETGTGVSHCPTSNTFIGSGLCDVAGLKAAGIKIGLATDVGGGSSFSMLRTMAAAYEVAQLRGQSLHPAQLLWLSTAGSADLMRMPDIGNLSAGNMADMVAIDLSSTPVITQRVARASDFWESVFPTIMLGDDRAISQVWVAGKAQR